jgi:threonine/homoserine/homoserine lactone efflux protein
MTISLSGVMMPGPMLAVTIARSYRSPYAGVLVALGHLIVELPLILLLYFGVAAFLGLTWFRFTLGLLGGLFLIYLSINMFRTRARRLERSPDPGYHSFAAGIATSLLNPFFLLWWLIVGAALVLSSTPYGPVGLALLVIVHWLCDFTWLGGISVAVHRSRHLWGEKTQSTVFALCSLLLLGFSGWFLWSALRLLV